MNDIAKKYDGQCISNEYKSWHSIYEWQCKKGHIWKAGLSTIKRGGWCPVCANRKRGRIPKYHFKDIQKLAAERGGRLLTKENIKFHSILRFECDKGHQWNARLSNIIYHGSWCPKCPRWNKLSLQMVIDRAKAHGDKCLSTEYKNCWTLMEFECSKGHVYSKSIDKVRSGVWCPVCGKVNAQIKNLATRAKNKAAKNIV